MAEALGLEVRQEKLLREVGYRVRSGACRVRETRLVLLDRDLDVEGRIEVLVDVLSRCPLEGVYVSPAVRELLERRRTRLAG
ncbi:MAG: hypothetical protein KatS3mg076_2264 [Candidatus Binatia bacterium]|nr:MAG: hypothetical protein KatS3mg076_2264 [Candidatus Binatia bacterium]